MQFIGKNKYLTFQDNALQIRPIGETLSSWVGTIPSSNDPLTTITIPNTTTPNSDMLHLYDPQDPFEPHQTNFALKTDHNIDSVTLTKAINSPQLTLSVKFKYEKSSQEIGWTTIFGNGYGAYHHILVNNQSINF